VDLIEHLWACFQSTDLWRGTAGADELRSIVEDLKHKDVLTEVTDSIVPLWLVFAPNQQTPFFVMH
jgi:hypothetical protein